MYSYILAIGEHNEMGINNHLPWHLPSELRYFRGITEWHTIIMGRKTFESLPHVLPNRKHIILTRDDGYTIDHPDVTIVHTVQEALRITQKEPETLIIGGAETFNAFWPYVDRIWLTIVHQTFEADTWFENLHPEEWKLVRKWPGKVDHETTIPHTYHIFDRITYPHNKQKETEQPRTTPTRKG